MKKCTICNEIKPLEEFVKNPTMKKDGRLNQCKECINERMRQKRKETPEKFNKNPEKTKAYKAEYYKKNKEKMLKRNKEYYEKNKEEVLEKQKQYNQKNKEKISARWKKWYAKNKENQSVYYRNWREKNPEIKKNGDKKYRQENAEKIKQKRFENREYHILRCVEWREKNPEHRIEYYKKYSSENREILRERARLFGKTEKGKELRYRTQLKRKSYKQKVHFTPHQRKYILDRDNWTCQECGIKVHDESTGNWNTPDKANIDHIVAISKGGNSEPKNLQVLCRTCNLKKKDKIATQMSLF